MKNIIYITSIFISHSLISQTLYLPGGIESIESSSNARLELINGNESILQLSRSGGHSSLATLGQIDFYEGVYDFAVSSRIAGTRGPGDKGRGEIAFLTLSGSGQGLSEKMRISYTGDIGIGTSTPGLYNTNEEYQIYGSNDVVLDVQGKNNMGWISVGSDIDDEILGGLAFTKSNGQSDAHRQVAFVRVKTSQTSYNTPASTMEFATKGAGQIGEPDMVLTSSGNMGIGTESTGNHKLAVEGSIGAREIKVEVEDWYDFVFDEEYKLRSLDELESFVNKNKHLPEIPSELEVVENGINLGEMNAKLLQKIEELTLYLIEMNKRLNLLEEENSRLKNY